MWRNPQGEGSFCFVRKGKSMAKGETYEEFVEKFKPKKTTDDCYTPPEIYEAVKGWACKEYGIDQDSIVRPFWPGGDYEHFDYPEGCVVLDNPPFSILTKICEFYLERGIDFFLFAPSLTCFSGRKTIMRMNHVICNCAITYENGAVVRTSFVTSFRGGVTLLYRRHQNLQKLSTKREEKIRRKNCRSTAIRKKSLQPPCCKALRRMVLTLSYR